MRKHDSKWKTLIPLMKLLSISQSIAVPVQAQEAEFNSISEEEKIGQMQDFLNSFEEDDSDTEERQE